MLIKKLDKEHQYRSVMFFMLAAMYGHTETVKLLLEKGADVNATDDDGDTALMLAASYGYMEVVKLLLEKGADVNATDDDGDTALEYAIRNGHTYIIELLEKAIKEAEK